MFSNLLYVFTMERTNKTRPNMSVIRSDTADLVR